MPCNNQNRCRRMAVRVTRIFNGARREQTITRSLPLSGFTPINPAQPLTYLSTDQSGAASVDAIVVSGVAGSRKSRIEVDYSFPVAVTYADAGGNLGRASSRVSDSIDLLLTLPTCPYEVEVETAFVSRIGTITADTADITGCLVTTLRVLVRCDLVIVGDIVTYPLATLTEDNICADLF